MGKPVAGTITLQCTDGAVFVVPVEDIGAVPIIIEFRNRHFSYQRMERGTFNSIFVEQMKWTLTEEDVLSGNMLTTVRARGG